LIRFDSIRFDLIDSIDSSDSIHSLNVERTGDRCIQHHHRDREETSGDVVLWKMTSRRETMISGVIALGIPLTVLVSLSDGNAASGVEALSTTRSFQFRHVERMSCKEFQFQRQQPGGAEALDRPILITDALQESTCESLCERWIQAMGNERITVQRQQPGVGTNFVECTVAESLDLMMQSTPDNALFAFVEGLLEETKQHPSNDEIDSIHNTLTEAREALFAGSDDSCNWFDLFPPTAKPSDCVVLAGEGATSTLHRDPFEWTGTSLCLEGRKIWRFLAPPKETSNAPYLHSLSWDKHLQSYRLNSMAWDCQHTDSRKAHPTTMVLSAGWQSDLSLYIPTTNKRLSARTLADLSPADSEEYLENMATSLQYLAPHGTIQTVAATADQDFDSHCFSVVQHTGELLLIPPYWYHQTYAPEPSFAVASQRCGSRLDAARVMNHVLSLQPSSHGSSPQLLQSLLRGNVDPVDFDPKATVDMLFHHLANEK
jgi:Cupin-like domain